MNSDATSTAIRPVKTAPETGTILTGRRPPAQGISSSRDASIDVIRSLCLVVVVALHALMVGVSLGPHGPVLENALDGNTVFAAFTWFVQIMPLFFIAGGFSSISQWRAMSARGATAADYVRGRLVRLLVPAVVLVGLVGAGLVLLTLVGVPADIVSTAGYRISQPLWFLAVYLGSSALVPLLAQIHDRAKVRTMVGLLLAIAAVDGLRILSGQAAFGYANLLFVWLFIQQLGFWLADGSIHRLTPTVRKWTAGCSLAVLLVLTWLGVYSGDMLANLNPPTGALVLLAVAQLMIFSMCQAPIRRWAANPSVMALVSAVGSRAMTVYLWHMPVLVGLAGLLLISPLPLPVPGTAEWWLSRPAWLAAALCVLVPTAGFFGRFERINKTAGGPLATSRRATVSTLLGVSGVVVLLIEGITPGAAAISVLLFSTALIGQASLGRLRRYH
ncbi:acyltransferase [Paenarthrobacter nitroguajacolicus]|uniref:Acyltransferase n=1 Tax=Paenarthrobacter nitroguajacolicus TaxID=211146 RepID=A0A558GVM1_PAENT|nr:acyltransferase [Paenarthrobacter nitroguajacolicus]TVU60886.1 acyltransferase [Paenarthrobacter nitroguajacolicus]